MSKPVVLLDCDGVIADFVGPVLALLNAEIGTSFTREDVTEYDIPKSLGLDQLQRAAFYDVCCSLDIGDQPVLPGAVDGVDRLREIADVVIVTAPWIGHETWAFHRINWLYHRMRIGYRDVIITPAKHHVRGDLLVDDKTSTLTEWRAKQHPNGRALPVQWETPHNRKDGWMGVSTNNWAELREIVERVAKGETP